MCVCVCVCVCGVCFCFALFGDGSFFVRVQGLTNTDFQQRLQDFSKDMQNQWNMIMDLTYPIVAMFSGRAFNRFVSRPTQQHFCCCCCVLMCAVCACSCVRVCVCVRVRVCVCTRTLLVPLSSHTYGSTLACARVPCSVVSKASLRTRKLRTCGSRSSVSQQTFLSASEKCTRMGRAGAMCVQA